MQIRNLLFTVDKTLSYYEKALTIRQKSLPADSMGLASLYDNIGLVYEEMKNYSKAYSFYEKSMRIAENLLPANNRQRQLYEKDLNRIIMKLN